ncbi:MAG TPA: MvaI/BcnI family restriction endonuclease [Rhizomicrobium sp.]
MPARYGDLAKLRAMMSGRGARRLYAKRLAPNDNSKNQVYLGGGFEALNILPFGEIYDDSSEKNQILKAPLKFVWLQPDGRVTPAPSTQLILYPQYPEVRMSGFLKGAKEAPNDLMTVRQAGRILFLGIEDTGTIIGAAVSPDDALAKEFEAAVAGQGERVFYELTIGVAAEDTRAKLLAQVRRISDLGWITSKRLMGDGSLGPCEAPNCGGYTLEAELGIRPNGISDPDYLGWEVKQHSVAQLDRPVSGGPVTLMTPEPTGGYYREKGVEAFLRKYGYADRMGREDRINFGGVYRAGVPVELTGLTLVLDGYDAEAGTVDATKGITLLDKKGNAAAVWGYTGLISHWARKHERAVYIPSIMRGEPERQYRYSSSVLLGQETDFFRFLKAMAGGHIYYDPAIKLEAASSAKPKTKRRSQFRVRIAELPSLYVKSERVTV